MAADQKLDQSIRPICDRCGHATRLVGIEAHERMIQTDLHTYACDSCSAVTAFVVLARDPYLTAAHAGLPGL